MGRTALEEIIGTANSLRILIYVADHPGCLKSDIYLHFTGNSHTREHIARLGDVGVLHLEVSENGRATTLTFTEKGHKLVNLLLEAEALLDENGSE